LSRLKSGRAAACGAPQDTVRASIKDGTPQAAALQNNGIVVREFKHIIWDWNGTLLDDAQACVDALNILLKDRKLPAISHEDYLEVFDFPVRDYYLKLGFDFSKHDWDEVSHDYHKAYARTSTSAHLREGAQAALTTIQAKGLGLSILSACELKILRRMINERGILPYFEHIYGLNDLYASSKIDLGHALFNNTGLKKQGALLIGDTTHDYEVAQAMGIPCILMTGGHQSRRKLAALGCPVVQDFSGVLDFLFSPNPA
jgi:phosphoglycolate phosphatase